MGICGIVIPNLGTPPANRAHMRRLRHHQLLLLTNFEPLGQASKLISTTVRICQTMPNVKKKQKRSRSVLEKSGGCPLFSAATAFPSEASQTRILSSLPLVLEDLLSPAVTSDEFLKHFFRQQAVHIPTTMGAERIAMVRERIPDPKQLYAETASDNVFVWLSNAQENDGDTVSNNSKINSIEVSDPDVAYALYQAGHATYCRAPPEVEKLLLTPLFEETGLACGQYDASGQSATTMGRGEVEVFISSKTGSITGWHTDFQQNFTIQLSGRKRWSLQRGTVAHVLRGVTPHYKVSDVEGQTKAGRLDQSNFEFGTPTIGKNAIGPIDSIVLEPGDVLYFPAGMWHKIEVLEPGVSINCSLMSTNYASLVCESLQHLLLQRPEWRASVCRPASDGGTITDTVQNLLEDLPGIIEKWVQQEGAAQGMLPPVLQHSDVTTLANTDADQWEEMPYAGSCSEDGENHATLSEKEGYVETGNDIGDDSDDLVNLDDEPPSNAEFCLSQFDRHAKLESHRLVVNPLALLLNERDISRHYQTIETDDTNDKHIYILNVNYAGNEAHESHVRCRLQSDQPNLDKMSAQALTDKFLREKPTLIAWLVYLGYLVWVPSI